MGWILSRSTPTSPEYIEATIIDEQMWSTVDMRINRLVI